MALTPLTTIKNWFKTNLIPTQQQFYDMFDSFRHKSDKVAATDVDGLANLLSEKASNEGFQSHTTADNAHAGLFGAQRIWLENQVVGLGVSSTNLGALTPLTVIPTTINVHGFAVEAGTYTNCGGIAVPANSLAFISRVGGVWGISKTTFDLNGYLKPIDVINKADLSVGKNLFNSSAATIGSAVQYDTGGINVNATYDYSDYIPVTASTQYVANFVLRYVAYYNSSKVFVSGGVQNATTFTPSVGVSFVRITLYHTNIATQQLEIGSVATAYTPYKIAVQPSQMNLTEYTKTVDLALNTYLKTADLNASVIPLINKKADLVVGKNLFDYNDADVKRGFFIGGSGAINSNAGYSITGFIPLTVGQVAYSNKIGGAGTYNTFYDSNKAYIGQVSSSNIVTAPAGCAFVRYSLLLSSTADIVAAKIQIELGSVATTYEAFSYRVPTSELVLSINSIYSNKINTPLKQHFLSTIENNIYINEFQKRVIGLTKPYVVLPTQLTRKNDIIRQNLPTVGSYSVTNELRDLDFNVLSKKDFTVVVTDLSKTTAINVLSIGDSYTDLGYYVKKMGQTIPNINHVGMCKTTSGTDVKREGRTGWTLSLYMTELGKNTSNRFFSPFLHPVAPYTYYGNTDLWKKVYIGTAPVYEIATFVPLLTVLNINSSGVRATPVVNDVMYFNVDSAFKYWDGATWTVISEAALSFTFNFAKYLTTWSIPTPDVVTVLLGMNDFRSLEPSAVEPFFIGWKANMDAFIANAKVANANIKIAICTVNSVEYNELSGKANASLWEGYNQVITYYDNREGEKIYISDTRVSADNVYGFPVTKAIPFSNYTGTETIIYTGGDVHLNTGGMNQLGEKLAATIQYIRP